MSTIVTNTTRRSLDHFEPEAALDPAAQRKLKGQLEQIDYTAFAANREIVGHMLAHTDLERFKRLAAAAAHARARWIAMAVAATEKGAAPTSEQINQLALGRRAFEELTEAYEAMRRMVERGYLPFRGGPAA